MPVKAQEKTQELRIIPPDERRATVRIIGTSPLLTNRMTEAAIAELTNQSPSKRKGPKIYDAPETRWKAALHTIDVELERYGLPGASLFSALVTSARFLDGVFQTELKGMFRIPFTLLEIEGAEPRMHFSMGRPQRGGPLMPIYRPIFDEWEVAVPVSYDASLISLESLVNLFERAGYSIGVGAFRPECKGTFGTFKVKEVS